MKIFNCIFFWKVKRKIKRMLYKPEKYIHDDKKYLIELGKIGLGYKMDLDNPRTLNEKINWYKLNYRNDLMIKCVDKYLVRDYIKEKGLDYILLKNYGVYDSLEDIKLDSMPNQFVAKVTGDSGGVVVCKDKNSFYKKAIGKLDNLNQDYSSFNKEWPYKYVKNRIIVEELIKTNDGHSPKDYKFFCFNGEPKFLYVASERDTDVKFDFFDLEWNHIDVKQGHLNSNKEIKKPNKLNEMIDICKKLSSDFPFVRVDLYYENDVVYFSELTFFSLSGLTPFFPKKYDRIFGDYFDTENMR